MTDPQNMGYAPGHNYPYYGPIYGYNNLSADQEFTEIPRRRERLARRTLGVPAGNQKPARFYEYQPPPTKMIRSFRSPMA